MSGQDSRNTGDNRLRIVRLAVVAFGVLLALRVVQVQVVEHERWLQRANGQWSREVVIDAERGNLYDRNGRPLAVSVTTTQVGLTRRFMENDPRLVADLAEVTGRPEAEVRQKIESTSKPHIVLGSGVVLSAEQRQRLRRWKSVTLDERCSRYYPTDGMAASLVGFYRQDPDAVHATGLELSLEEELAGVPGLAREIQTAQPGVKLGRIVLQNARHGRNLVLTLDAGLQEICEQRLLDAVTTTNAKSGSVLVLDPSNGDVLAAASYPLMDTRSKSHEDGAVWNNRNFTTQFEPGSLFKIFSGAALLHHGAVDTGMVFNCDNNSGSPYGISNDKNHDYGHLSFGGAMAVSSNVYFAKAAMRLDDDKLFSDLSAFGFGERTKFPYKAQPRGSLRRPEEWNGADKPCISIGQAVSATAVQLGMALCAVANGGTLYAPRCVKEVRGRDGGVIEEVQPAALRRVMAPPLADVLRGALKRVVAEGTGSGTKLDWIASGGKTGTAQKSRDGHGYTAGAYMSSFGGIVPIDDPRLVVLVVLDEPDWTHHYASQSAVPLYRGVIEDIRRCTDWLSDAPGDRTGPVVLPDPLQLVEVPDVLYLRATHANDRLGAAGLRSVGDERDGVVVGQVPAAGTRCEAGTTVALTIAGRKPAMAAAPAAGDLCPDFTGMSNRQIRSLAARLGLQVVIDGVGYASAQDVAPNGPRPEGPITVTMETTWN
ncbi:MAG: PASTA domain-containing protein [bacterium]|nr:PASTA domain-containing protein [bacterium]